MLLTALLCIHHGTLILGLAGLSELIFAWLSHGSGELNVIFW
jgi:hypothetical protein